MTPLKFIIFSWLILSIFLSGCGDCGKKPDEWSKLPKSDFAIPPYARYLERFKICLDPGHGGQAHLPNYRRGPTGLREADANLRVLLYLRDFLEEAGAIVFMTRTGDSFVSIPERSEIANRNGVDFFISLHHNFSTDPQLNYTSTWYHRDADDSPASLDLARYIQQSVAETLRLPQFSPTGLYSDQLLFPAGFGVLRLTNCARVLCEASFYSNPDEEERLKDPSYNRREAYGYFLGMARYVASGFPKGILVEPAPELSIKTKMPRIKIQVMDGLHERGAWMLKREQVFSDSIRVKLDGVVVPHQYFRDSNLIVIQPKRPLANGVHLVETQLINYYGNHNLPGGQRFKVAPPAARIKLRAWTDSIPPDGGGYVGITVTALDKDGLPIADDEPIHGRTSLGKLAETVQLSKSGIARFYLHPDLTNPQPGFAKVEASYKGVRKAISIRFGQIQGGILQGAVSVHESEDAVADATVRLVRLENKTGTTDASGHFFFNRLPAGKVILHVSKVGYYNLKRETQAESNKAQVVQLALHPIADGICIGQTFVLDARFGGAKRGTPVTDSVFAANLNLAVVKALKEMLEAAGAKVSLVRENDQTIPLTKRVKAINAIKQEGYYLRIDHGAWAEGEPAVIASHSPGNQVAENYLTAILEQFRVALFETPVQTTGDETSPEIRTTNKTALALEIRSINHPNLSEPADSSALIAQEAYAIFLGTVQFLKGKASLSEQTVEPAPSGSRFEIRVVNLPSRKPIAGAIVALDGTLPLVTDAGGSTVFRGVQRRQYRLVIHADGYPDQEIEAGPADGQPLVVELNRK